MSQAALNTTDTITSGVNEARFLEHLRTMFSTSTTVLAECMQNARRAGATAVSFAYDADTKSLSITDDGIGIADFAKLIVVAESGWSQEVQDSEQPFGIGFFSVSFAADQVIVESRGKQIQFSSEDLIAKRQIAVKTASFIGGTRITLNACKLDQAKLEQALLNYAKGFAIPVLYQGKELPRPHAMADLVGTQTDVGFIHVPGIHSKIQSEYFSESFKAVYCQGLPMRTMSTSRYDADAAVIHIDHRQYQPRMPDRDTLIDAETASKDCHRAIRTLWLNEMTAVKATLSAREFANTYWQIARNCRVLHIMNDVPVLPSKILSQVSETPYITFDGSSFWGGYRGEEVTPALVDSGAVKLFDRSPDDEGHDDFLRLMWAEQEGAVFIDQTLPDGHWALSKLFGDLTDGPIKVSGKVITKAHFGGNWVEGEIKIFKDLAVTWGGITHPLLSAVAVGDRDYGGVTFLVPHSDSRPGFVVRQASSYVDSSDYFQDSDCDEDQEAFNNLVAIMSGEAPEKTLEKCLLEASASSKTNLRNKQFRVQFDANGKFTVIAE